MKLVVLALLLLFSLGFFVLASIIKEDKRFGYALLSGFVMLLFAGLMVAGFGLEYPSGSTITDNGVTIDVQNDYSVLSPLERTIVSLPLIIAGFWGIIVVIAGMRSSNYEADEE